MVMTKTRWTAIRYTAEAIIALGIVIYVVMRYETQIAAINWRMVALACIFAGAIFGMYRWQMRDDNTYDVMHMLMKDGRADLQAHIIVVSFGLAAWLIVQQALADKDVVELMLGVLGIFVVGKAAGGFSDAMKTRGPPVDQSRDINILPNAKVQQAAAPVTAATDLPASAGRGVEPLAPKIGKDDVGKSVALVGRKRKRKKGKS